jgi:hypothetical protein
VQFGWVRTMALDANRRDEQGRTGQGVAGAGAGDDADEDAGIAMTSMTSMAAAGRLHASR